MKLHAGLDAEHYPVVDFQELGKWTVCLNIAVVRTLSAIEPQDGVYHLADHWQFNNLMNYRHKKVA